MVADSEWDKAVGRMPPTSGTLLARFKANVRDNYIAVDRAWMAFVFAHRGSPTYAKAVQWWQDLEDFVFTKIKDVYIKKSLDNDLCVGPTAFGNPKIGENVCGTDFTW